MEFSKISIEEKRKRKFNSRKNTKIKCINEYGGKCRDCGNDDIRVLELHHTERDGKDFRTYTATGKRKSAHDYDGLKKMGYPKDLGLVVLCANCHRIEHSPY